MIRAMIDASATGRLGTPADIAAATAFPPGPESAFAGGTDLLVDGGVGVALRTGAPSPAVRPPRQRARGPCDSSRRAM